MATATPGLRLGNADAFGDSLNTVTVNGANKRVGALFIAPKAGTITHIGFQANSVATSGALDVRLEGVTTSGLPDGTLVATGASASYTLSAAGFAWVALGTAPTVAAGDALAAVVAFQTSSSINAALGYSIGNSRQMGAPLAVSDNGSGTWSLAGNYPVVAIKYSDGTIVTGCCPLSTFATASPTSSTNPNERASVFVAPFDCTLYGVEFFGYPSSRTTTGWEVNVYSGTSTSPISGGTITGNPKLASSLFANRMNRLMFPSPLNLTSGSTYRLALKSTGSGALNLSRFTWASTAERDAAVGPIWSDTRNGGSWLGESTTTTEMIAPMIDSVTVGGGTTVIVVED